VWTKLKGGGGLVERDVERSRTGPSDGQMHGSGGDGRQLATCEAGEGHGEADGWGPTAVPWFQTG
jgi:hypothetical protein